MAFQPDLFNIQYRDIAQVVSMNTHTSIVEETNKRVIIRCDEDMDARNLVLNLKREGYRASARKGRFSSAYYVQALLNSPF